MKVQIAFALATSVAGLALASPRPLDKLQEVDQWILDLSSPVFATREEATKKILAIGEPALQKLGRVEFGNDPEQAFRARELIQKIDLSINADTDPALVSLVERYLLATPEEKMTLLNVMRQKRAWRQILKLFAREKNGDVQSRYQEWVGQVAIIAARECLEKGDSKGARDYLEMAPADNAGLLALADFHRNQGTLDAELKRAKLLPGRQSQTWQLALHRAAGNLVEARDLALALGEVKIAATLSALLGDPLPWLRMSPTHENGKIYPHYTELAIRRWSGQALRETDLKPLLLAIESKNSIERQNGMAALFLLGQPALAEGPYAKDSPLLAFSYFESLQRIPEALRCLGLKSENPDYAGWVTQRFSRLIGDKAAEPGRDSNVLQELVAMASFLELRGKQALCDEFFRKPLAELAASDSRKFTNLLRMLCVGFSAEGGAPLLALHAATDWAGANDERWEQILNETMGEQDQIQEVWAWMAELDPAATQSARFEGLLTLFDFHRDPQLIHERWMDLFWKDIAKTPVDKRARLLLRMQFLLRIKPDVASSLKVWKQLSESQRSELPWQFHIEDLAAAERWDEAASYFLKEISQPTKSNPDLQPALHAYAASALRKAGREKEALVQDRLTEKLALGKEAGQIAMGYQYGADYTRAAIWWQREVIQAEPESDEFEAALEQHLTHLIERQDWQTAAAVAEIQAQMAAVINTPVGPALRQLRLRLSADFTRALATLKQDRAGSLARLKASFELFPTDGSLADAFFPALLQTGLMPELERCYDRSWQAMKVAIEQYPEADNLLNTAAWLASRAQRNLPEAEKLLEKALALNPKQSSYLDTMAETYFAMGNRPKAIEWSRQSLNFLPKDPQISRQYERFKSSPLPPQRRR
jgi:hypothetical protein